MPYSRRAFLRGLGLGGAGLAVAPAIAARGLEAARALGLPLQTPAGALQLDSNENPYGPGPRAVEALRRACSDANRYPSDFEAALRDAVAAAHGVPPEWVLLGSGSGEILRVATLAFTAKDRALVTAAPTFEEPTRVAQTLKVPLIEVPLTRELGLDLEAMATAGAPNAGLFFCCNPNNPTGVVHGATEVRRFIARARQASPNAVVLVDEAYHEYVDQPAYGSMLGLIKGDPRLIITRTFSKVFGLAGLRVGYGIAQAPLIEAMRPWRIANAVNALAAQTALACVGDSEYVALERRRNREARTYTRELFERLGYPVVPSDANFLLVDIRREVAPFREECRKRGVLVGRPFPPLATHCRISIGTLAEMQQAAPVFRALLSSA
jgi:histidinol-phosphate aminotransferase